MFGRGIKIFTLFGIPVYLDLTFFVIVPLFAWLISNQLFTYASFVGLETEARELAGVTIVEETGRDGQTVEREQVARPGIAFAFGILMTIGLYVSVLVHEFGHALTARLYGVRTDRVTLWLLGGVASFERMPRHPGAEAIVAIVGPLTSYAVAGLLWGLSVATPQDATLWQLTIQSLSILNLVLATFNLLPALPLDGGRVLRSLLALGMPYLRATQISAFISKGLALLLVAWGFFGGGLMLIAVAIFIYMAVNAETRQSAIETMLKGVRVRDVMTGHVQAIPPSLSVGELMAAMQRTGHLGFPVVDDDNVVLGMVGMRDLQEGYGPDDRVEAHMRRGCIRIGENQPAMEAFEEMGRTGFARCAVVDEAGKLLGLITKGDIVRFMQLQALRQTAASLHPARGELYDPYIVPRA